LATPAYYWNSESDFTVMPR